MKILGASIAPPAPNSRELTRDEPAWGVPLIAPLHGDRLAPRAVQEPQAAEVVYPRYRYPATLLSSAERRYAEHAVATYESVQQLRQRQDLRSLSGVDVYA